MHWFQPYVEFKYIFVTQVDITRLRDIPDEATFEAIRNDLLERLRLCRGKFSKQSQAWAVSITMVTYYINIR